VLGEIVQQRLGNSRLDEIFPDYSFDGFLGLAEPRR
jgi:hypothetical protein